MSLETGNTESASEAVVSESAVEASSSGSGYSAVDPGYDSGVTESVVDELASLKAENTKKPPSETLDDASETDGDTEETAETPTVESVDSSEEISDELLDRALGLGYTLEEMKDFEDVKSLEKEVTRVEALQKRVQARQGGKTPPVEEAAAPVVEADPEPDWESLIEQGHDPDMIALQKQNWTRAQKAEALVQQLLQADQQRAFNAQCERFDETLNKLDGFETILGNGRRGELEKSSPEMVANRQKVFTKMLVLKRGYEAAGEPVPPEVELIHEAVQASFYKHAQSTARERLKGDIKKAGSQALSRPKSGGAKALSGPTLALQKEESFWKSKGL